jgi:hypothetical protein
MTIAGKFHEAEGYMKTTTTMRRRATIEMLALTPTFALSDGGVVDGKGNWVEVARRTVVGANLEVASDALEVVVELGKNVGAPWTSVIEASVRRAVGTPTVGGYHGVRSGDTMLPSCCSGPQPQPVMAAP